MDEMNMPADIAAGFAALDRVDQLRDLGVTMFGMVNLLMPLLISFQERGTGITQDELAALVDLALDQMEKGMDAFEAKYPHLDGPI